MPIEALKQMRVDRTEILKVYESLKAEGFTFLTMITAVCLENGIDMVYLLDNWETKKQVLIKAELSADQLEIDSLYFLWAGADWLEREVFDMFGVRFNGHPNLIRILLPEDAQYFPLLKSFQDKD